MTIVMYKTTIKDKYSCFQSSKSPSIDFDEEIRKERYSSSIDRVKRNKNTINKEEFFNSEKTVKFNKPNQKKMSKLIHSSYNNVKLDIFIQDLKYLSLS